MEKIIDLSSMFEESAIDYKLKCIQKELIEENLSQNKLYYLADELHLIFDYIDDELLNQAYITELSFDRFSKTKETIGSLLHTCYQKWLDKSIDIITDDALAAALESAGASHSKTSKKVKELNKKLEGICQQNALSLANRHMVKVAKKYLTKAEDKKVLAKNFEKLPTRDAQSIRIDFLSSPAFTESVNLHETCLSLYEVGGDLFHHRFNAALESFYSLPKAVQDDVKKHLEARGACITKIKTVEDFNEWQKNLFIVIQTLLGVANQMIIGAKECEYPEKDEIIDILNDPFFQQEHPVDL